jgi:hypothetical protein
VGHKIPNALDSAKRRESERPRFQMLSYGDLIEQLNFGIVSQTTADQIDEIKVLPGRAKIEAKACIEVSLGQRGDLQYLGDENRLADAFAYLVEGLFVHILPNV